MHARKPMGRTVSKHLAECSVGRSISEGRDVLRDQVHRPVTENAGGLARVVALHVATFWIAGCRNVSSCDLEGLTVHPACVAAQLLKEHGHGREEPVQVRTARKRAARPPRLIPAEALHPAARAHEARVALRERQGGLRGLERGARGQEVRARPPGGVHEQVCVGVREAGHHRRAAEVHHPRARACRARAAQHGRVTPHGLDAAVPRAQRRRVRCARHQRVNRRIVQHEGQRRLPCSQGRLEAAKHDKHQVLTAKVGSRHG
mmetsp:Transcript_6789/g.20069  ORF Transcript_6789/g.20069 Transcript_6789/m.20069 type:complete len:261 (+) Transcript_6789:1230-2012(+)